MQLTFNISLTRPTMVKDFPVPGGPCTRQIRGIGKGLCTAFAAVEMTFSCDSLYSCELNSTLRVMESDHYIKVWKQKNQQTKNTTASSFNPFGIFSVKSTFLQTKTGIHHSQTYRE